MDVDLIERSRNLSVKACLQQLAGLQCPPWVKESHMADNYLRRRLIRLLPLAVTAIALLVLGPDRLGHLQAWQRWWLVGGVAVAFISSIALSGQHSRNTTANAFRGPALIRYVQAFWWAMAIFNVCASVVGIITVVLLHNALPVRYLILAPIVNLILAGLFYRVARSVNLDQSRLT